MVSVCLPSDALLQHLPSYLGFSYLGRGVFLHGCSSKVQPLLLTLDEGYLLTAPLTNYEHSRDFSLDSEVQVILYPQQLSKIIIKIHIVQTNKSRFRKVV